MAPAVPSAEIQFARRLASGEKRVRDRAARKLRQFLSAKTQAEAGGFSQEELLKIWKGLFYCMWVQDEPLLQEELANTVSHLIHVVSSSEAQHLFIQTFWQTMNREWKGIDKLHLDKYHMLIRLVLRQSFEVLRRSNWEESQIKLFLDVVVKEILGPDSPSPDGVRFHFIDIYLDELSTVGGRELLADQNLKFIDPFCKIAAKTKDHTLVQTIARGVFEVIVDQSPFVHEETVEEQKRKVSDSDFSEEEMATSEKTWEKATGGKKTALGTCLSRKDGISDEQERGGCATSQDPGRRLQFDYKAVAHRLLEITNRKNIPPFNRKHLFRLIRKFQGLSGGEESRGNVSQLSFAEDIAADEDDQALSQERHKKKRKKLLEKADLEKEKGNKVFLAEEEESEGSIQKRKKKKKKRSHPHPETQGPGAAAPSLAQSADSEQEATQRQAPQVGVAELSAEATSVTGEESGSEQPRIVLMHSKRKRPRRKILSTHRELWRPAMAPLQDLSQRGLSSQHPQGPVARGSLAGGARVLKRKRKLSALPVNGTGLAVFAWPSAQKACPPNPSQGGDGRAAALQCRRAPKKKAELSGLDLCHLASQKMAILKKRKKMKEMSNAVEHNGALGSTVRQIRSLGSSRTFTPSKKKLLKTENDFVKFDSRLLPKPLFIRRAKSSATACPPDPAIQLNRAPSSSKKVTFGLNRNMTAEFKKTDKSILVSPEGLSRVAFNPEQRPLHGVLKTPSSSPASTPLAAKKPLAALPKQRPRAADFF